MATADRHSQKPRRKTQSFSSSLLDSIYLSIDDPRGGSSKAMDRFVPRKNDPEQEIESLRRAIRVEKWMESISSNSAGSTSTDSSSMFSSSERDYYSSSAAKPKREGRFTRTKSRALKIYGDLKRVKEPISPGGKIVTFLNSLLFGPRSNLVRKSRSMNDANMDATTRSCLNRNPNKSKRTVRFCPVDSVILDEEYSVPNIGSRFLKRNMESLKGGEGVDDMSCASSDLFELENIGRGVGIGVEVGVDGHEEELPVYGTTSLKMNQAIASGLIM